VNEAEKLAAADVIKYLERLIDAEQRVHDPAELVSKWFENRTEKAGGKKKGVVSKPIPESKLCLEIKAIFDKIQAWKEKMGDQ
jgi:hypothetical protein